MKVENAEKSDDIEKLVSRGKYCYHQWQAAVGDNEHATSTGFHLDGEEDVAKVKVAAKGPQAITALHIFQKEYVMNPVKYTDGYSSNVCYFTIDLLEDG